MKVNVWNKEGKTIGYVIVPDELPEYIILNDLVFIYHDNFGVYTEIYVYAPDSLHKPN